MSRMENEPIGRTLSPFVVGVFALVAAGLSVLIYWTRGTWPAEYGGWAAVFFVCLGLALIGYASRVS